MPRVFHSHRVLRKLLNWVEHEFFNMLAWIVAGAVAYLSWPTVVSIWNCNEARYLGIALRAISGFMFLRGWQLTREWRESSRQ